MTEVLFDAYFEGLTPVIVFELRPYDMATESLLHDALIDSGMEHVRDNIYLQKRGGLDLKLLKSKMRKHDFKLKRGTIQEDVIRFPDVDYVHFIKGDFLEEIVEPWGNGRGEDYYFLYEYKFDLYGYQLFKSNILTNPSGTKSIKLNVYFNMSRICGKDLILKKYAQVHPEFEGRIKYNVDRYYYTVEQI